MSGHCIDENTVLEYVEGLLDSDSARQVERHATVCDECRLLLSAAGEAALEETGQDLPTRQRSPDTLSADRRPAPAAPDARLGDVLQQTYVLRRFIGRGGMGTVYEAEHLRLNRRFAVKVLREGASADPVAIARLKREAQITSRLAHPHIVKVVDFNHGDDGAPFIVMELLEGEPLAHMLRRQGATDLEFVAAVARQTASALHAAHGQGVIHRDLKPNNVFLCRDMPVAPFVKVMDFGISKVVGMQTVLTGDVSLLGSPRYMAPEQARGRAVQMDQRADVFTLGVVIFEMLAGEPPFIGDSVPDTLYKIVFEEPAKPPQWRKVPEPLCHAVLRALSKEPADRPGSMVQLWHELAAAFRAVGMVEGLSDPTLPSEPEPGQGVVSTGQIRPRLLSGRGVRPRSRKSRTPVRRAIVGILLVALVLGLVTWMIAQRDVPQSSSPAGPSNATRDPKPTAAGIASTAARADSTDAAGVPTRRLSAESVPTKARVWVGERFVGRTPLAGVPLPGDATRVTIAKRGYRPWRGRLALSTEHTQLRVTLQAAPQRRVRFGQVSVQSKAKADGRYLWATVHLDGRRVGQTALTLKKVPAGRHRIEVRRPGYRSQNRYIWVRAHKRSRVTFELTRAVTATQ